MSSHSEPQQSPDDGMSLCPFCDTLPELIEGSNRLGSRQGPSVRCANSACVAWRTNLCEGIFTNATEAIKAWNVLAKKLRQR
ncbi:MAG: hypothetical protein EOP84_29225 [Verrucomicrobiaceae bacterium]|nr:MAG: hypothetical protein EOP84_29225 [Verrucomicrobiaceae bacterium]